MPPNELRVRLEEDIRVRLEAFRDKSRRSLTAAVNQLLAEALDARDAGATTPPRGTPTPNR